MEKDEKKLIKGLSSGSRVSLSRLISIIESDPSATLRIFHSIKKVPNSIYTIGITGPPGAGKSTLTDQLIQKFLGDKRSVGVVAVDPTSPFTGGALLGDRVRMNRYMWEENVFIRSMGSHGDLGGLANKAQDVGDVLAASGKDVIIFETVGVGQGEHDVAKAVDVTIVVLVPESGDEIQLMKAGLIEIADLFIINKADRDGAQRLAQLLQNMLHTSSRADKLEPPVFTTVASDGTGIDELFSGINDHLKKMEENGDLDIKKLDRHRSRIRGLIQDRLLNDFWTSEKIDALNKKTDSINSIKASPYQLYNDLLNDG